MIKFLDNEHLCGAAGIKKQAEKMAKDGKLSKDMEEFNEAMVHIQPLMEYACKRGIRIGAAAAITGMVIAKGAEVFGPRIREAVMKKLGK